jgi:hypothetical protein
MLSGATIWTENAVNALLVEHTRVQLYLNRLSRIIPPFSDAQQCLWVHDGASVVHPDIEGVRSIYESILSDAKFELCLAHASRFYVPCNQRPCQGGFWVDLSVLCANLATFFEGCKAAYDAHVDALDQTRCRAVRSIVTVENHVMRVSNSVSLAPAVCVAL